MLFVFESLQEFNLTANFMLINIKMGGVIPWLKLNCFLTWIFMVILQANCTLIITPILGKTIVCDEEKVNKGFG